MLRQGGQQENEVGDGKGWWKFPFQPGASCGGSRLLGELKKSAGEI